MTRKTFAIVAVAGLLALTGLAFGMRPSKGPAANAAEQTAGTSVETTLQRRTEYVSNKDKSQRAAAASGGDGGSAAHASNDGNAGNAQPKSAPRPTTSASGTGDDDHGSESKRDDDHGADRDDHGDDGKDD